MAERGAGSRSRRLGSSRRKQLREGSGEVPAAAPSPGEESPCPPEIVQRVQDFFRERAEGQEGFFTRSDMQKLQEEGFPCSREELELVFDGLDAAGSGRLSTEEFTAGLWQFLSSQKASRDHRRRKTASRRVRLVLPSPVLEGAESEERRHFATFMEQLGTDNIPAEQEIWQLWLKLRQDEPQLLGNSEDFLAKMRHLVQEAKSKKEALEVTLKKRVAEHDKEVQQLCKALEQQIQEQLEQEGRARCQQRGAELQPALDAGEREVQRLVRAQVELETRCHSLRSRQQTTSTETQQLEESNMLLEDHLQHLHQQLQQTQRQLQRARAAVAWENTEECRDRAVAELPSETPVSPQMSVKKNSETRIRRGSQSNEPKAKSTYQVVWVVPPADTSLAEALERGNSTKEDPFPEFLNEEPSSEQSSLLREMNDAIAALSKQLKSEAPNSPPTHPQDDAEPQTGLVAATAPGVSLEVLQETVPGHKMLEGDPKEGPVPAELCTPDMPQAGGSVGAGHGRAQEPGEEQGESPEEVGRMFLLQGTGAGVEELMLKAAEHLQGAPGESPGAGGQALLGAEAEGWMQQKSGWEKAQLAGEVDEAASSQAEKLAAGPGPAEAGEAARAGGGELGPAAAPGESPGTGLREEAAPSPGLSQELEGKPGELPEPEPPSRAAVITAASQGTDAFPEGRMEEQPRGGSWEAAAVPPAWHGESGRAAGEGTGVMCPREAAGGDGAAGAEGLLLAPWVVPPAAGQGGGAGADVRPLEVQGSGGTNLQLLPEMEAALQPPSEVGSPGKQQGGDVAPDVQLLEEEDDKPELGLGDEMGAAAVQGEDLSPAEIPAGSPGLGGLLPVKAQAVENVEAEDVQADTELWGGLRPEALWGGKGVAAVELKEEAEDGAQGQDECEMLQEPVLNPQGAGFGQGEGAAAGAQAAEETEILDTQDLSTDTNVQLLAETDEPLSEVEELKLTPGWSRETHLKLSSEASFLDRMQREREAPEVQPLDQVNKTELVQLEAGGSWADTQLQGVVSTENPQGEEPEDGEHGQGEHELLQEPVLDLDGTGFEQREGAGAGVQPWEEAEILDTLEGQSTDANVQLLAETDELRLTPAGSTETDLQLSSKSGFLDAEEAGSVSPDMQPLDQVNKTELAERMQAGGSWEVTWPSEGPSLGTSEGEGDSAAIQLKEEAENGAQGQGEHEILQEPVLNLEGAGFGQGGEDATEVQSSEEAEILCTLQDQSTDANVQLLAETDELRLTPAGSTETDLQLSSENSLDTEQGGSVTPDVQPLDQVNQLGLVELEAGGSWADTQLQGVASPITPGEGAGGAAVQLKEKAEDGAQGQSEHELLQEPVLDLEGAGFGQREGAGTGVQAPEEAEILDTLQGQSTDANVQLLAEMEELQVTPAGSTETDLRLSSESGFLDAEEAGSVSPDMQPLDQVNKTELEEGMEWLSEGPSLGTSEGEGDSAAIQLKEEAENGAQGQGEYELLQEPVLNLEGAGFGQGEGTETEVQSLEEAEILDTLQDPSTDANVQLMAETDHLQVTPEGSTEESLPPLGAAGMQEREQGQAPDSEAVLGAAHTTDMWEEGTGAHVATTPQAALHLELATAIGSPGLEAKLGELPGSAGQIPEDAQPLETAQNDRVAAEEKPLGESQGLEGVQAERLEAGERSLDETLSPGVKQEQDDGVSVLASPVSEVTVQSSPVKLEMMMQEDVLIPDVCRVGASGQTAQSELQEQVSAQAAKMRFHTASEKPPDVMETEQVAARPAEHPKREVPPASTPHTSGHQEEDAGNDVSGVVLRGSSLGHAATSSVQLLGEQSEDLSVAPQQEQQEAGEKMSEEVKPSPGEPGAGTTDGIGAAPRGCPEASLDPDHFYNVLFVGDSHVGKTSFLYRLHTDTFNPHLTATLGLDYQVRNLVVDNKRFVLRLWDSAGQERYHSLTKQFFRRADGVVLMYDVTSDCSFSDVSYWLSCIQEGAEDGVTVLLLGNKADCTEERRVPAAEGERLAKEHQLMFYECSAASGHNVTESMVSLVRLLKVREDKLKTKVEEVPKPPQKKKGCC